MTLDQNGNNIVQILITDLNDIRDAESRTIRDIRTSLSKLYDGKPIQVLSKTDIQQIISNNFDRKVLESYNKLEPYSYKSDLAKYCILYKFGGMTIDLPIMLTQKLSISDGKHIVCFRDAYGAGMSPWAMATNLIMARPGREEMLYAIDLIVKHCQDEYYGSNFLDPTGPGVFGRALAAIDRANDLQVGEFRHLTGNGSRGLGFVDADGAIVGLRMKTIGADLSHIGVKGTNNYAEIYKSRHIYGEIIEIAHDSPNFCTTLGQKCDAGIFVEPFMTDLIVFGPYVSLNKGRYIGTHTFGSGFVCSKMIIDVHNTTSGEIASKEYADIDGRSQIEIEFELKEFSSNIEVRLFPGEGTNGYCTGLKIRKII